MSELKELDAYLTSGRYHKEYLLVTCPVCSENTVVLAETEYGATYWEPESCSSCHEFFEGGEDYEDFYPEEEI